MNKFYAAQEGHIVNVLPPINISGGKVGDRFHMKKHSHATIIVQIGVSGSAPTAILVKECDAASAGTANAIGFDYYAETTDAGDTLGAKATASASGITPSANNNIFYVIELDHRDLSDGYPWVEVSITCASGNSVIASIVAVLSGSRYGHDQNDTVIA